MISYKLYDFPSAYGVNVRLRTGSLNELGYHDHPQMSHDVSGYPNSAQTVIIATRPSGTFTIDLPAGQYRSSSGRFCGSSATIRRGRSFSETENM